MDILELVKKEARRRGLSGKTIKTYNQCLRQFLKSTPKDIKKITKKDIQDYLDQMIEKDTCGNTLNVHLNAIKFAFQEVLNRKTSVKIKYSKTAKKLPIFLTKDEIKRLINSIDNPKHKLIIELMYSAGLRVGEVVILKKKDFDLNFNIGWVRGGKGNKDRMFIIAKTLKGRLAELINNIKDENYLFPTYKNHISIRSIQEIIKKAGKKAMINKPIHPHTLRHSFATHLIQDGYDVATVQSLLGHNSSETTMIYLHIASPNLINAKSPLDSL